MRRTAKLVFLAVLTLALVFLASAIVYEIIAAMQDRSATKGDADAALQTRHEALMADPAAVALLERVRGPAEGAPKAVLLKPAPLGSDIGGKMADWSATGDPAEAIALWEDSSGVTLPADYKAFITANNGARIYPYRHKVERTNPHDFKQPSFAVEEIFAWDRTDAARKDGAARDMASERAACASLEQQAKSGAGLISVGAGARSDGLIVMSVCPFNFGQIYLSTYRTRSLYPAARSFNAFLTGLYDDANSGGYLYFYPASGTAPAPNAPELLRVYEIPN